MILLMLVVIALVGFSEINFVILGGDIAMVAVVLPLEQRIRALMRRRSSKALLQSESPLNWVTACTRFSFVSLLSSLAYALITSGVNIGVNNPPIGNYIIVFAIGFFLFGFVYIIRIAEFLVNPSSKTNIFAGKAIKIGVEVAIRVVILMFIASFQIFNGIMFHQIIQAVFTQNIILRPIQVLYTFTLISSFVGMFPIINGTMFHLKERVSRWGWVAVVSFVSPWMLLIVVSLLLQLGIKLV